MSITDRDPGDVAPAFLTMVRVIDALSDADAKIAELVQIRCRRPCIKCTIKQSCHTHEVCQKVRNVLREIRGEHHE